MERRSGAVRMSVCVVLAIAAWTRSADAQSACDRSFTDTLSLRTVHALNLVTGQAPVWDDFTPARYPILLVADSAVHSSAPGPMCAAIWRAGAPLERLELPSTLRLSTPFYGMVDITVTIADRDRSAMALQPVAADMASALRARGVERAVVLPVPLSFARLGPLGDALTRAKADPVAIQADLAVHEGFHLHVQFPNWGGTRGAHAWPVWDRQPNREEVRQRCYAPSDTVKRMVRSELDALVSLFDALPESSGANAAALRHGRRFIEARLARYAVLDTTTVGSGTLRISCREAEDIMELEEGIPQWIGHATTVAAKLSSLAARRASYGGTQPDVFYLTTPLQLWALQRMVGPVEMLKLTRSIARSPSHDGQDGGVFARFQHYIDAATR